MISVSQRGERFIFDVLVIGGGIAGLTYCLSLSQLYPNARIALISKLSLTESNTAYAQGGISAVPAKTNQDSFANHIADTLRSADGLGNNANIEYIIQQGPDYIQQLMNLGVMFDRDDQGLPNLAQEGGHSQRRIFHCGDQTGLGIIKALIQKLQELPNLTLFEYHMAVSLLENEHHYQPGYHGEVCGAYILDIQKSLIHTFLAKAVVLATGGAGKTFRYTTNPDVATGDGIAMAYRIGARIGNMEFYQFHPTLFYHRQVNNFLISEAVRGEGAYLRLPETGERFMARYAPEQMELATRDIVARAIFTEIENSAFNYVYLDITHHSVDFLEKRFPNIFQTLKSVGLDMSKDMIPVVPAAHYLCGGILANPQGETDKQRLYAIGETAFTGFHGANRLASNSLLEAGITAREAAQHCSRWLSQDLPSHEHIVDWNTPSVTDFRRASQINAHWRGLRGEMTSYAGIVRTEAGLNDLLQLILTRKQMIEEYYWKHTVTRDLLELRNIVLVAELIVCSALRRRESRGGHYREDFPEKSSVLFDTVM